MIARPRHASSASFPPSGSQRLELRDKAMLAEFNVERGTILPNQLHFEVGRAQVGNPAGSNVMVHPVAKSLGTFAGGVKLYLATLILGDGSTGYIRHQRSQSLAHR